MGLNIRGFGICVGLGVCVPAQAVESYMFMENTTQNRHGIWHQEMGNNKNIFTHQQKYGVGFRGDIEGWSYHIRSSVIDNNANARDKMETKQANLDFASFYRDFDVSESISIKVGKFVENWQIAYGITPFSFMSPDSRTNPIHSDVGVWGSAVRYYAPSNNSVYTLYVNADTRSPNAVKGTGYRSVGIKVNTFMSENTDLTFVAQKYKQGNVGVGMGFRSIMTDSLALYGTAFVRQGTTRAIHKGVLTNNPNFVATKNPIGAHRIRDGKTYIQSVMGLQYTTSQNFQYWLEYGYDQRGMNTTQWETYKGLVNTHKNLSGRATPLRTPNLSWDSQLVHDRGLRQHYLWGRISKPIGTTDVSASVKLGQDKSALWQASLDLKLHEQLDIITKFMTTSGGKGTEFGEYYPFKNRVVVFLRASF